MFWPEGLSRKPQIVRLRDVTKSFGCMKNRNMELPGGTYVAWQTK